MKIPNKISLAFTPTPLQVLRFNGMKFIIKRDDLTGIELSGNKVRKLEYLLYQAKKEKADYIFTSGGEQSNHARATVIAASKLGIKSKLFLWGKEKNKYEGNLFFNKFFDAEISFLTKKEIERVNEIMFDEREKFLSAGKEVYVIPEGGSSTLGIWGYVTFFNELSQQINLKELNGIVAACGSGGTAAGLLLGAALSQLNIKIYAVNVLYPEEKIRKKILQLAEGCRLDYSIDAEIDEGNLIIINGFSEEGYKNISPEKISLIKSFAKETGIVLDPAYTGKALSAYHQTFLNKNKGMKNLFLHTGGIFGAFAKRENYLEAELKEF
jgi:D-cysteine desulfhydrase